MVPLRVLVLVRVCVSLRVCVCVCGGTLNPITLNPKPWGERLINNIRSVIPDLEGEVLWAPGGQEAAI